MENITPALLRLEQVLTYTGLTKTPLYSLMKQGKFPAPIKINDRAVAWKTEEVNNWIKNLPRAEYPQS